MSNLLNSIISILLINFTFSQNKVSSFDIPLSESNNKNSIYYFKSIEDRLDRIDTTITAEQIISLTKFYISENKIKPRYLDSLSNKVYQQNEKQLYHEAINSANLILEQSPNNITGHKEIALAYFKSGNKSLSNLHFSMLIKIVSSILKYSDGSYDLPFVLNNFFEGISIYEVVFDCNPSKRVLMLDQYGRLLGSYNGYSSKYDEIIISYSDLTHWLPYLKEDDYIKEIN